MTWVVLGHTFLRCVELTGMTVRNVVPTLSLIRYWLLKIWRTLPQGFSSGSQGLAFEAVLNAFPSVDSFFLMGGTLTAYIVFKELERAGSNIPRCKKWRQGVFRKRTNCRHVITSILYYVHRYIRLTIPYALILAVVIAVLPHMAYGPFWSYVIDNSEVSRVLCHCFMGTWESFFRAVEPTDGRICFTWTYFLTGVTRRGAWGSHGKIDHININCQLSIENLRRYLVCDMIFHFLALPLVFYPMHFLWKKKVTYSHLIINAF